MTAPFDSTHVLKLGYKSITLNYAGTDRVGITLLDSGYEDRNLRHSRTKRVIGINWADDNDVADSQLIKIITGAYLRASTLHQGFYLDHYFFEELIPVRFNSDLNLTIRDAGCECGEWVANVQELQLIEVFDAPLIPRS